MRYKLFGRGTGLRVSEFALGCGTLGTRWGYGADADESRRIFDTYVEAGGTLIDAADSYQVGQAEELLGDFVGDRRNHLVLTTKFALGGQPDAGLYGVGNSRLAMVRSVEASLRRLKTDRVDLLWVHLPDGLTASEELVRGLDDLARAGKIVYAGLSDFQAWRVARAATIAELRGLVPVAALQVEYSLVERTPDHELLPMARALGLGLLGWSPLGGGLLTGKYRRGEEGRAGTFKRLIHSEAGDARKAAVLDAVLGVSAESGLSPIVVSLAWMGAREVMPILGARTAAQLGECLAAAGVDLAPEHVARLDAASAVAPGFPHALIASRRGTLDAGLGDMVEQPRIPIA